MMLWLWWGCPGQSSAVYGHTEIRNNRRGKQLAAEQSCKDIRARGCPVQGLTVKGGKGKQVEGGGVGVYKASAGVCWVDL